MAISNFSKIYFVGSYSRLSKEDIEVSRKDKNESSSISNQKTLIKDFLKDKTDLRLVREYADDGVSGSSFARPDFEKMMEDIEAGIINCVVVKDLSRFGREYIGAGNLLERVFPSLGVRFISINDNIDTLYGLDSLMVAIKNIMNDSYCRDISVKIRSNLATKRAHGEFVGSFAVYGYEKDPNNRNKLVIDEFAGHVVQNIFRWKIQGMSCATIAKKLNEMGILSPYDYKMKQNLLYNTGFKVYDRCLWQALAVRRILENETYTGVLVQGKTSTPNHKVKKTIAKSPDKWVRVEDTHEPLISKRDYELVQKTLTSDSRTSPGQERCQPLSGLLTCGNCGANLIRKTHKIDGKLYAYYQCQENVSSRGKRCFSHAIRAEKMEELVLETISKQITLVIKMDECLKHLNLTVIKEIDRRRWNKQIAAHAEEVEKYNALIKHAYEDVYANVLTDDEYIMYKAEFEKKKHIAMKALEEAKAELLKVENNTSRHCEWVTHFLRFQDIGELTREMVLELVDSVVLYDKNHVEITLAFQDEYNEALKAIQDLASTEEIGELQYG